MLTTIKTLRLCGFAVLFLMTMMNANSQELPKGAIRIFPDAIQWISPPNTVHQGLEAQIISYLKLSNKRVGILVNFNVSLIKNGYKRIVNNL